MLACGTFSFILFFFSCFRALRALHSFPTRRSSDLLVVERVRDPLDLLLQRLVQPPQRLFGTLAIGDVTGDPRSEEHTSELQSHSDLVCRLLLEKKKKQAENQDHNARSARRSLTTEE